jgi:probable HAF family extracellular repeat protein
MGKKMKTSLSATSWVRYTSITICILAFLTVTAPCGFGQVRYSVSDLGSGWPYGVNNQGQVVGYTQNTTSGGLHAFLYSGGATKDLGTFGGNDSFGNGINNSGQVVGSADTASGAGHAFLYSGGVMKDLGTGTAIGINDNGQIAGQNAAGYAILYSSGAITVLGALGGNGSYATAINLNAQVVGNASTTGNAATHAFLYSGGTMKDLGTLGGTDSLATGLNNNGQVVGSADSANGYRRAYLYSSGAMADLGTFGGNNSWGWGINNNGQVVGSAETASGADRAFLYGGGAMADLNNLISTSAGWTLMDAMAINDNGQIVGDGINPLGQNDAFLLTPIPVPEPTSIALLALGSMWVLLRIYENRTTCLPVRSGGVHSVGRVHPGSCSCLAVRRNLRRRQPWHPQ